MGVQCFCVTVINYQCHGKQKEVIYQKDWEFFRYLPYHTYATIHTKRKKVLALSIRGISDYGLVLVIPRCNRLDSINSYKGILEMKNFYFDKLQKYSS